MSSQVRPLPCKTALTALLASLFLLHLSPVYAASDQPWRITRGEDIVRQYEVPSKRNTVFSMDRVLYDIREGAFFLDMAKVTRDTYIRGKNSPLENSVYILQTKTGTGYWLSTLERDDFMTDDIYSLSLSGRIIDFDSVTLRETGTQMAKQPFGPYEVMARFDEDPESLSRQRQGKITLEVIGKGASALMLSEKYIIDSNNYKVSWSPDGRYLLIALPNNTPGNIRSVAAMADLDFIVAGPFETTTPPHVVERTMIQKRAAALAQQERGINE